MRWLLEAGKDKGMDSPLELSRGTQTSWHLDFSPVKTISDFYPPGLKDNKFVLFEPLSSW